MLDLKQIETFYPESLRVFKKNILREYLQYKILDIIYDSQFAFKLIFMGGTAIRIVHGNNRFSEDLDFDNLNLKKEEFDEMSVLVKKSLVLEGYQIEIRNVFKEAFHCYISIPNILYENQISPHQSEKLMIRLDAEPQKFEYSPEKVIINKFDIFTRIYTVPADILSSQKIYAILNRKRAMGRDFFDTVYLFGRTKPNMDYLKLRMNIKNVTDLKDALLSRCENLNLKYLARDLEPFIVHPNDIKKVLLFHEFVESMSL